MQADGLRRLPADFREKAPHKSKLWLIGMGALQPPMHEIAGNACLCERGDA